MNDNYIKCLELNISEACNYKCNYCIFHRNTTETSLMKVDLACKIARDYADYLNGRPGKIYLGAGEPTLNWEAIEAISNVVREEYSSNNISISFMTNGSNINYDRVRFLKEKNIQMGLSIDGNRVIQNYQRPPCNLNIDTYDAVINVLNMANEYKYSIYSLSATYKSLGFRSEVSHVIGLCKKYGITELDLDYDIAALSLDTISKVAKELFDSYSDITKENIEVFGYWIIPVINQAIMDSRQRCYCGNSVGNNICVSAQGQVKICGYDSMSYGAYTGFDSIYSEKYMMALNQYKRRMQLCESCKIKDYCFGQCIFMDPQSSAFKNNCKLLLEIVELFS